MLLRNKGIEVGKGIGIRFFKRKRERSFWKCIKEDEVLGKKIIIERILGYGGNGIKKKKILRGKRK